MPSVVGILVLTTELGVGLLTLLSCGRGLGAYIGLNGWMPLRTHIAQCYAPTDLGEVFKTNLGLEIPRAAERPSVLSIPVLLCHTTDDEVIDTELGQQAYEALRNLGMNVTWKEHEDGGHLGMLKRSGLDTVVEFLRDTLDIHPAL